MSDEYEYAPYVRDKAKPTAYIFDIDGTCAHNLCGRGWYDYSRVGEDAPDAEAIFLAWQLASLGHKIIFLSGRKDDCYDITHAWLKEHTQIDDFILLMRHADDNRKDAIVKYEIFDQHVRDHYNVVTVFDDRDQVVEMWRKVGVKCYQVEYGSF